MAKLTFGPGDDVRRRRQIRDRARGHGFRRLIMREVQEDAARSPAPNTYTLNP